MIHLTLRPDPAITQRHIGLPNRRGTFINEARRIADSARKTDGRRWAYTRVQIGQFWLQR
jgi:hypothetical protein